MSHPLYVAFIWHQHQPFYKSLCRTNEEGRVEYRLPWVRLHGTKDYLDLVLMLQRYPKLHQTINLVPCLILQLEDYIAGRAVDPYLTVALTPTGQLDRSQKQFILEHFFDANYHTLIAPHPRYAELYEQRQQEGIDWCLEYWDLQDYSDLLAWHNLAWIDPLFWDDPEISQWLKQGRNFSLSDRQQIYKKQQIILRQIIPQHRQMQESGQLEIITSPYTHPILPLLADTNSGRVAIPEMILPEERFQWPEDMGRHLRKGWELYCDRFGQPPKGLWPSEQSVSPQILSDIAQQGFNWICSDEAVLGWTLQQFFHRDATGNVLEPEIIYRPYRLETPSGDLSIVFRDHRLSDLIGFTYGSMEPRRAAADLVGHLEAIARSFRQHQTHSSSGLEDPWLVTIALDGENCWEFYPQDGKPFLETLYQLLSDHNGIQLVTVSEFLEKFPPTETLSAERLHSGSWVDGSFSTWIGDPVKNRAWDLLTAARRTLDQHPEVTEETNPKAWEALYAAEGSDWFWWLGEGHSSNQDAMFDQLFREHLIDFYEALSEPVPDVLYQAIEIHIAEGTRKPQSFIHPLIDGLGDEQDWDKAGRLDIGGARGTMHHQSKIQRIFYGLDHLNFYIRVDFARGIQLGVDCPSELHLFWFYPDQLLFNSPIPLENLPDEAPLNYLFHHHFNVNLPNLSIRFQEAQENLQWSPRISRAQVGLRSCLEIAIPWADLQVMPDWKLRMILVLSETEQYQTYFPQQELIALDVP